MAENLPLILTLVGLLGAATCLSAAEAALLRVRASAVQVLADTGDRGATRLLGLIDDLPRVMNTVLLVALLLQISAATVTGLLAERWFGNLGITLASIGLTLVMFVYAEAIPKTYALRQPMRVAVVTAPAVKLLKAVLHPVVSVLVWFADLQSPGRGIAGTAGVTEEELRRLAMEAAQTGEIAPSDLDLMERAFRLGDQRVAEILVPRTDVVAVAADTSVRAALEVAIEAGHRRLPVYGANHDDMRGFVRLRDLARAVANHDDVAVRQLVQPLLATPESKRVVDLLREMQRTACHFALVVDEHGGTAGVVTIEDLVEELVGEIADEGEEHGPPIEDLAPGRWQIGGGVAVADVAAAVGGGLPEGDWKTFGGLIVGVLGRIPRPGDRVRFNGFEATVSTMNGKRVGEAQLQRLP